MWVKFVWWGVVTMVFSAGGWLCGASGLGVFLGGRVTRSTPLSESKQHLLAVKLPMNDVV